MSRAIGVPGHLLVFGYGYAAERVGRLLRADGWSVTGTSRTPAGVVRLRGLGVEGVVFHGGGPSDELADLLAGGEVTHVLDSIPPVAPDDPDEATSPALAWHATDLRAAPGLQWCGIFSTTGVYGDAGGDWVDESSPLAPKTDRARRRVAVESRWSALADDADLPLQIFRLPGIYGPGRSPLDRVRAGHAHRIFKEGTVTNRIHVDDIAGAVRAGILRPEVTGPINVSDDLPAPGHEVMAGAAELLGLPAPPAIEWADAEARLPPVVRSFYEEDRRIRNRRLRDELEYDLTHPDWRSGLGRIHESESRSSNRS